MTTPVRSWVDHVADATMPVDCEGGRHTVRWHRGAIVLDDHGALEDEEAVAALGGKPHPCLDRALLWRDAAIDGGFMAEWASVDGIDRARRAWLRTALERARAEGVQEFLNEIPSIRANRMAQALVDLPNSFLNLAAVAAAERALHDLQDAEPHHLAWIVVAVRRLVRRSMVTSMGAAGLPVGGAALIPFTCDVVPGIAPGGKGRVDGRRSDMAIEVDPRWLVDVWAPGAAVVDRSLTLALDHDTGNATLLTWERAESGAKPIVEHKVIRHRGDRWIE